MHAKAEAFVAEAIRAVGIHDVAEAAYRRRPGL